MPEVSKEFDLYWNSASAYPASGFVGRAGAGRHRQSRGQVRGDTAPTRNRSRTSRRCARRRWCASCSTGKLALEWATAEVVYDDPAKTLDTTERTDVLLFPELMRKIGRPEKTLDLVSPYFVPGDGGTERWRRWPNAA